MSTLAIVLIGSLIMSSIALIGGIVVVFRPHRLQPLLIPLVSLSAGSLLGGALFHLVPEGFAVLPPLQAAVWMASGFTAFLAVEQFMHWHHSHRQRQVPERAIQLMQPTAFLILLGDGFHNLICGLGITSAYLLNPAAGVAAWLAALLHELPQELGDFGVLVHSGLPPRRALVLNLISALTFPIGALFAWSFRSLISLAPLVLFASGNFLYLAASDLVPEIKAQASFPEAATSFAWFSVGQLLMLSLAAG